jgi:hypothetical protein
LFPPLVTKLLSRATGVNMTNDERIREVLAGPLTGEVLAQRAALGWVPYAIEWRRATAQLAAAPKREQVPFGMRVSSDCHFLEENPEEMVALETMLEGLVEDKPLRVIADDLNQRKLVTRSGERWTQVVIFDLLPRLIEASPKILARPEWAERRKTLKPFDAGIIARSIA